MVPDRADQLGDHVDNRVLPAGRAAATRPGPRRPRQDPRPHLPGPRRERQLLRRHHRGRRSRARQARPGRMAAAAARRTRSEFSLKSHQKAIAAQLAGEFKDETTSVDIVERFPNLATGKIDIKTRSVSQDEGARADSSLAALAKLRPVFAPKGSVTAGNSSQTSDGSGALILVSEKILKQFNLTPLARFVSFAVRGVPPEIMGIGPKEAIPVACRAGGITQDQIDWFELNEAFAAQSLAVIQDLGLDPAKVNPMGGAIALGHPLGATGAIRSATVIHALRRKNLKYGMVTMCVGTGMGAAGIFERV